MRGSRGKGQEVRTHIPLENHKWLWVFLESGTDRPLEAIGPFLRTPIEKQLDPSVKTVETKKDPLMEFSGSAQNIHLY